MSLNVKHTTETIRFDQGISMAEYAQGEVGHSARNAQEQSLLPGSTTVSQAVDALFPTDASVSAEVMDALVAGNSAVLRTPGGFGLAARSAARLLRGKGTPAADAAAREIETLLADIGVAVLAVFDIFQCRCESADVFRIEFRMHHQDGIYPVKEGIRCFNDVLTADGFFFASKDDLDVRFGAHEGTAL